MKTIPFSLDKYIPDKTKVVTRDGRDVRILCTDLDSYQPIVGAIKNNSVGTWDVDGTYYSAPISESCHDLFIQVEAIIRAWQTVDEVPIGAMIKNIGTNSRYLITGWRCARPSFVMTSGGEFSMEQLRNSYVYSLDHGKTWHPCGVEE